MKTTEQYHPTDSFLRVATACPEVSVGDVATNVDNIRRLYETAANQDVSLVTFPELSITGYTLGDLVMQKSLLDKAEMGLTELAIVTAASDTALIVGVPLRVEGCLYNCAAVIANGKIRGIVPKSHLPNYNEFYERRWYETWQGPNTEIAIGNDIVPFGTDMLFQVGGVECGVEICEDLWVQQPPSTHLARQGALIIANPSASPEQIGKADYRRNLVGSHSARLVCGYLYAGCHQAESTAEIVMGGHQLIDANGKTLAEKKPFEDRSLTIADIDIDHLEHDRLRQHTTTTRALGTLAIATNIRRRQEDLLAHIDRNPYLPDESLEARDERLRSALEIQAQGLAMRMEATHQKRLVLGLSGGLDSTLALIVAHQAATILGKDPTEMIHTITMPGPASTETTQDTAQLLAEQLNVKNTVIPITELVRIELAALEHDETTQDITYENVQARARTSLLFNYGNKNGAIVLGTGDLSELAVGWCTYNGDQQSHYNVNGSVPKTVVRELVAYAARQPQYMHASATLTTVLGTIVSPELTSNQNGEISQSTDEMIGPVELRDFYTHYLLRWGDTPAKIRYLAGHAFEGIYTPDVINHWHAVFLQRFAANQFKRENMPSSPKVGSDSVSPRGDFRAPPDMPNGAIWK